MDMAVINYCIQRIEEKKNINKISSELGILDSVRIAFASIETKDGHKKCVKYRESLIKQLNNLYNKEQESQITIWDKIKGSKGIK